MARYRVWWRVAQCVALFALAFSMLVTRADAHVRNENYVWINVETDGLSGRFEIAFDDIQNRLGIALPAEPELLEAAIIETAPQVQSYIRENFRVFADGREIQFDFAKAGLAKGAERRFASYAFRTEVFDAPDVVTLHNDILLSWETPLHRSLAVVEYDRKRGIEYQNDFAVLAFGPNSRELALDFSDLTPVLTSREFVWQGIIHVVGGLDHVLFLLALLLTSVLVLRPVRQWEPVDSVGVAVWNAFWIVTIFAVAHSITLALTVLGFLQPNIQLIETLIAFSIVAVALNNLYPVINTARWLLIVFFGLFHGMGFASAMSELQFRLVEPAKILFNFNIGIEIGQLVIVAVVLPVLFALRKTEFFRFWLFRVGNLTIAAIAGYWTITRGLGL